MEIDPDYLFSLIKYFKEYQEKKSFLIFDGIETKLEKEKPVIYISSITKTPNKFITHVKYYIDCRPNDYPDVHFSQDFTVLTIMPKITFAKTKK